MRRDDSNIAMVKLSIGYFVSEFVQATLLSLGLLCAVVLCLNGLDAMATVLFVDNTVNRIIEADPERQKRFLLFFKGAFAATFTGVAVVRTVDRLVFRRAA